MATASASLFGKLPTTLDFVRIHHDSDSAIAFDTWTQECVQELAKANATWPGSPARFVFAPARGAEALVGVVVGSRDRAGRKFPLAIFSHVSVATFAARFATIPTVFQSFLSAAEQLLSEVASLDRQQLGDRLQQLPLPGAETGPEQNLLAVRETAELATAAGGFQELVSACAAFLAAAQPVSQGPDERPGTLDCPVAGDLADVLFWLELGQRALSWRSALPSFFWSLPTSDELPQPGQERLLLSFGPPPPALPLWLGDARRRHGRLTALRNAPPREIAHATVEACPTLGELLSVLTPVDRH